MHNRASLTRQCLNALVVQPPPLREAAGEGARRVAYEIIVVDDASTDLTGELLAGYGDRIRVVTRASNGGFARACNDGAAAARGEYLVFLNNDTIPRAGWLEALVGYADDHPAAAAVGSKLLFPNDTIQHAGVAIGQDRYPHHLYAGFPADHPAVEKSRRFQIVTAGCALMRRAAFERAGGFDPAYVNSYEDVDLCLRLGDLGYEVHYCHDSVLTHLESVSQGRWARDEQNKQRYRERWLERVRPDDVQYYLEDGLLEVSYGKTYPVQLVISPLLAVVGGAAWGSEADRLLATRSRQVLDLLGDNIRLGVRVHEAAHAPRPTPHGPRPTLAGSASAEAGSRARGHLGTGPAPPAGSASAEARPRVLAKGRVSGPARGGRLLSILLPTKNGAAQLRELLPAVLGQRTSDRIEIVAVDSGSEDDTVEVLRGFGATVVAIEPRAFGHGPTRNLASRHARGDAFVFINQSTLPAGDRWLANLVAPLWDDPALAGVCSRVLPREDADLLVRRDGLRDPNAAPESSVRAIADWLRHQRLTDHELRLLINFHTVSAAIRPRVFAQIPFRDVLIGEDVLWAKEALEAGLKIRHEASSVVFHSHRYSYLEHLGRNVDDGFANHLIVGRQVAADAVAPSIAAQVRDDWRYLAECGLGAEELDEWRLVAALRRTAQVVGQWVGSNHDRLPRDLVAFLSLTERIKAGALGVDRGPWAVGRGANDAGAWRPAPRSAPSEPVDAGARGAGAGPER